MLPIFKKVLQARFTLLCYVKMFRLCCAWCNASFNLLCLNILAGQEERIRKWILVWVQGFQLPICATAAAQSQQETKLQMDWRILMCATCGCLQARLNNLGKCVVTTAWRTPISVLCVLLCYAPYILGCGLDVWVSWQGLSPWVDWLVQFSTLVEFHISLVEPKLWSRIY